MAADGCFKRAGENVTRKVNTLTWKFVNIEGDSSTLDIEGVQCFGITDPFTQTVYLRSDVSAEMYRQTLIHELTHVFTFSYGVHLMADELTEESVCDFNGAHLDEIYRLANEIMEDSEHAE